MYRNDPKTRAAQPADRSAGFTLIEVLITLSILATGLLAVASMQIAAIQVGATAGELTEGVTWAQDRLEELLALAYDHADLEDTNPDTGVATDYTLSPSPPGVAVVWSVNEDVPAAGMKRVSVTATWTDKGQVKTSTLTSVKSSL